MESVEKNYSDQLGSLLTSMEVPAEQKEQIITEEIKSGKLEWPDVAVNYNLRGPSLDNAMLSTAIFVPFATGESLGISEERNFRRPWLMSAGTAFSHIMIPGQ